MVMWMRLELEASEVMTGRKQSADTSSAVACYDCFSGRMTLPQSTSRPD
jgi:hypothetical protein